MRTLGLAALALCVLVVTAILSPWVAAVLGSGFTFARVFDRLFELLLLAGVVAAWRRLDLGTPASIGFRRPRALREVGLGLAIGLAGLLVGVALAWAGGALAPGLRFPAAKLVRKALLGLGAALAVATAEETLFRGVLWRRLDRDAGRIAAVAGTTALYAVVHALRTGHASTPLGGWSGIERLAAMPALFGRPETWQAVGGLALLGLLLAGARLRSGGLWVPIGIHAAWVAAFRVGRLFFVLDPGAVWLIGAGWPPFVGGLAGAAAIAAGAALLGLAPARAPATRMASLTGG